MSSRPSLQSEISSSIGSTGQNNINCNETKEEPFLSTITNPLAAGSIHARNEVYNDMGKGEVWYKFQNVEVRFVSAFRFSVSFRRFVSAFCFDEVIKYFMHCMMVV